MSYHYQRMRKGCTYPARTTTVSIAVQFMGFGLLRLTEAGPVMHPLASHVAERPAHASTWHLGEVQWDTVHNQPAPWRHPHEACNMAHCKSSQVQRLHQGELAECLVDGGGYCFACRDVHLWQTHTRTHHTPHITGVLASWMPFVRR